MRSSQTARSPSVRGVRVTAVAALLLTAGCSGSGHSDSYRLGYDSGVDWVNAQDSISTLEAFSNAAQACTDFGRFARMSLAAGKTYEEFMRQGFVGSSPAFTTQTVPQDLSDSDYIAGCTDGIGSTERGKFLVGRADTGSSEPATSQLSNSVASTTSITESQLETSLSSFLAGKGIATTSFQCPAGPYADGGAATCVFVREDDGTSWSVPVSISIQNGKISLAPDTPTRLTGGN